jgi:hypothetical protein
MRTLFPVVVLLGCTTFGLAADPDWRPITRELLRREKTGFGGLCGVLVDHTTGHLWVNLSDRGMFLSTDQGKSWKRVSDHQPRGRTETPGCWMLDPTGKTRTMVTALVYGPPLAVGTDRATTWKYLHQSSAHSDWCAVDWARPGMKFILALRHESGGLLLASRDAGQSFVDIGKGYGPGWVFDTQTAVVATVKSKDRPRPSLLRTTDGARSFQSCGAYCPVGTNSAQALPRWRDGTLYWLVTDGLIATTDQGATWKKFAAPRDALYGPVFGKDARHLFILTRAGVVESADGGLDWSKPLPPPQALKGLGGLCWLEYDPASDTLYLMKMGSDLYRLTGGRRPTGEGGGAGAIPARPSLLGDKFRSHAEVHLIAGNSQTLLFPALLE